MRKCAAVLLLLCLVVGFTALKPEKAFTEDRDTILLARTLYALAKDESYETKLALADVVMNRRDNGWFPATLGEVLTEQQQFPAGERYDDESLRAAHAALTGTRTLQSDALYFQSRNSSALWGDEALVAEVGSYRFYSMKETGEL